LEFEEHQDTQLNVLDYQNSAVVESDTEGDAMDAQ
jgi:hypothetical protein